VLALGPTQVSSSLAALMAPETVRSGLTGTLTELSAALLNAGAQPGRTTVLGLALTDSDIVLLVDDEASTFFGLPLGGSPFIRREADTDPRPLYFVPYDPDVHQSKEEREFCRRVLFERMHATVFAAVGHATPPVQLLFESHRILNDAMLGTYDLWDNADSRQHMRGLCRQLMSAITSTANSVVPTALAHRPGEGWELRIDDVSQHEKIMDVLDRFSCETLDLRSEPKPGLFDDE